MSTSLQKLQTLKERLLLKYNSNMKLHTSDDTSSVHT